MKTATAETVLLPDVYRFLAQSMHYPEPSWFNETYFSVLFPLLSELGWDSELQKLSSARQNVPDFINELRVDHTRLFINAVPHVLAPPYGSVYLSAEGTLYGPSTDLTKNFYRERGVELASLSEIPDHIVCELDFLAMLAEQGRTDDEQEFLRTLFRPWFVIFRDIVATQSELPFYPVIVKLIDFFTDYQS